MSDETGLRLHFMGFTSMPPGDAIWDVQVDTPRVGFVTAPTLETAKAEIEGKLGRSDWTHCDPIPPSRLAHRRGGS